jgi:hypothetical protein
VWEADPVKRLCGRALAVLAVLAVANLGCGAAHPPPLFEPMTDERAIAIQWRAAQDDGDRVVVTIVVDGAAHELGTLDAATELERGTPRSCALRASHPLRTEFLCGDLTSSFAAELHGEELVIAHVEQGKRREIRRVPVAGDALAVRPYLLD